MHVSNDHMGSDWGVWAPDRDVYHASGLSRPRVMLTIHNMDNSGECRQDEFAYTGACSFHNLGDRHECCPCICQRIRSMKGLRRVLGNATPFQGTDGLVIRLHMLRSRVQHWCAVDA